MRRENLSRVGQGCEAHPNQICVWKKSAPHIAHRWGVDIAGIVPAGRGRNRRNDAGCRAADLRSLTAKNRLFDCGTVSSRFAAACIGLRLKEMADPMLFSCFRAIGRKKGSPSLESQLEEDEEGVFRLILPP